MVPQQQDSPSSSGIPLFGSLLVDKNSSTPYSDATQVNKHTHQHHHSACRIIHIVVRNLKTNNSRTSSSPTRIRL
ncbi:hypothetical protein TKK_0009776 [Trichogramma kaykai]